MPEAYYAWKTTTPTEPRGEGAYWEELPGCRLNSLLSDEERRYIFQILEPKSREDFIAVLIKLYAYQVQQPIVGEKPGYRRQGAPDFLLSREHPLYSFWEDNKEEIYKIQGKLREEYVKEELRAEHSQERAGFLERVTWLVERDPIACFSLFCNPELLRVLNLENAAEARRPVAERVWAVMLQGGPQAYQAAEDILTRKRR